MGNHHPASVPSLLSRGTLAAALAPNKRWRAVLIVGISNLNLIAFYGFTGSPLTFSPVVGVDASVIFAAVNVLLFLFFWSDLVLRGGARQAIASDAIGSHK